jgi:aminopeptidase YwaD
MHRTARARGTGTILRVASTVVAVVAFAGCADSEPPSPPACDMGLTDRVDVARALDHLRVLSVDIGPRVASSPEETEAAEYIAGQLRDFGYEVEIQEFPRVGVVAYLDLLEPEGLQVNVAAGRVQLTTPEAYPLLTSGEGITGRVVDCGAGDCPTEVTGAVALLTAGEADDVEARLARVAEAGAAAAIVHGDDWRRYTLSVAEAAIPFVSVNSEAADAMRAAMGDAEDAGNTALEATMRVHRYETSRNVIATRRVEGNPDAPVVIFTAHYDSVEKSPGASDNGSGTSGLLEFARVLRNVPTDHELRFAAVGAEEVGLRGARYYVSELSEAEQARIVANFNTDMIGTAGEAQTQLFVNTLDGDNLVARSARAAREQLGLPEEMMRAPFQRGASDHVAFADVGIPAANFIWREPETIALEPWYHQPHDTFDNVSGERLGTAMRIVVGAAVQVICEAPEA